MKRNVALTREMEEFNKPMSSVRVTVEWLFGEIVRHFKFTDFKRQQSISLSPVAKLQSMCCSAKCIDMLVQQSCFNIL